MTTKEGSGVLLILSSFKDTMLPNQGMQNVIFQTRKKEIEQWCLSKVKYFIAVPPHVYPDNKEIVSEYENIYRDKMIFLFNFREKPSK